MLVFHVMAQLADNSGHQLALVAGVRALGDMQQLEQQQDAFMVAIRLLTCGDGQAIKPRGRQAREAGVRQAVARVRLQQVQGLSLIHI